MPGNLATSRADFHGRQTFPEWSMTSFGWQSPAESSDSDAHDQASVGDSPVNGCCWTGSDRDAGRSMRQPLRPLNGFATRPLACVGKPGHCWAGDEKKPLKCDGEKQSGGEKEKPKKRCNKQILLAKQMNQQSRAQLVTFAQPGPMLGQGNVRKALIIFRLPQTGDDQVEVKTGDVRVDLNKKTEEKIATFSVADQREEFGHTQEEFSACLGLVSQQRLSMMSSSERRCLSLQQIGWTSDPNSKFGEWLRPAPRGEELLKKRIAEQMKKIEEQKKRLKKVNKLSRKEEEQARRRLKSLATAPWKRLEFSSPLAVSRVLPALAQLATKPLNGSGV